MESVFVFGQIVSVVALGCGAVLSFFALNDGKAEERKPRFPAE